MIGTDEAALIEDGIEDGQPQHLSLGTADHRTQQAGLAFAQVVIDLAPDRLGQVLCLLDNETGMHSCLEPKPSVAGGNRRQEEASPCPREYRHRSGRARSLMSCCPRASPTAMPAPNC